MRWEGSAGEIRLRGPRIPGCRPSIRRLLLDDGETGSRSPSARPATTEGPLHLARNAIVRHARGASDGDLALLARRGTTARRGRGGAPRRGAR